MLIDLTKIPAGTFPDSAGLPVDWILSKLWDRAKLPREHTLRASLVNTHASSSGDGVLTLPTPFPPEDYAGSYTSVQDVLDVIKQTTGRDVPTRGTLIETDPAGITAEGTLPANAPGAKVKKVDPSPVQTTDAPSDPPAQT